MPAIDQFRGFAAAGGLMSYGSSITVSYGLVDIDTGRVLKGEKPADPCRAFSGASSPFALSHKE